MRCGGCKEACHRMKVVIEYMREKQKTGGMQYSDLSEYIPDLIRGLCNLFRTNLKSRA